jgi:hypothetical protein
MHLLYEKVYDVLDRRKIHTLGDVRKVSRKHPISAGEYFGDYSLHEEVYLAFCDEFDKFRNHFQQVFGTKLLMNTPSSLTSSEVAGVAQGGYRHLETTDFSSSPSQTKYKTLIKKSILYGTISAFAMGEFNRWGTSGGIGYIYSIPITFYEFLLHYRPLIQEDLVFPIASTLTESGISKWFQETSDTLQVNLTNKELKAQLIEYREKEQLRPAGYINFYLPELRNVPLETMAKIRRDEGDAFIRLQGQLHKLLEETKQIDSETKLLELMRETDHEVRLLDQRMQVLRKSAALKGFGVAVGLVGACLYLIAPLPVTEIISAALGASTLTQGLSYFNEFRENMASVHQHDFYLPWKLHQISKEHKDKKSI